jgi:hypothetical protein
MNQTEQWTLGVYYYIQRVTRRFVSHHYSEMNWVLYGYGSTGSLTAQIFGLFYSQILDSDNLPTRYVLEPSDWYIMPIQPAIGTDFFNRVDTSGTSEPCTSTDVPGIFSYSPESGFFDKAKTEMDSVLSTLTDSGPIYGGNITLDLTARMVALSASAFAHPLNPSLTPEFDPDNTNQLNSTYLCTDVYTNVFSGGVDCSTFTYAAGNAKTYAPFPYGIGWLAEVATPNNDDPLLKHFDSNTDTSEYLVSLPYAILMNGKMTNTRGGYGAADNNECDPTTVVLPLPSNPLVDNQGPYQLARAVNFYLSGQFFANYWDQSSSAPFNWQYFYTSGLGYNKGRQAHSPSTWFAVTGGNVSTLNSYWINPRYGQPYFHFQTYNITLQTHCCPDFWADTASSYLDGCKGAYNCDFTGPGRTLNQTLVYGQAS